MTNGKTYTCRVTATNNIGTSPPSPVSAAVVPRTAPGRADEGDAGVGGRGRSHRTDKGVIQSRAQETAARSRRSALRARTEERSQVDQDRHEVADHGHRTHNRGRVLVCCVRHRPGGTSVASAVAKVTLGAPGKPTISKVVQKNLGVTLLLLAPPANGKPITQYIARCSSTNGGTLRGAASSGGQIVVKNMSFHVSYTCAVTASNARGAGAATMVGPVPSTVEGTRKGGSRGAPMKGSFRRGLALLLASSPARRPSPCSARQANRARRPRPGARQLRVLRGGARPSRPVPVPFPSTPRKVTLKNSFSSTGVVVAPGAVQMHCNRCSDQRQFGRDADAEPRRTSVVRNNQSEGAQAPVAVTLKNQFGTGALKPTAMRSLLPAVVAERHDADVPDGDGAAESRCVRVLHGTHPNGTPAFKPPPSVRLKDHFGAVMTASALRTFCVCRRRRP